jgi:hypothetical protein
MSVSVAKRDVIFLGGGKEGGYGEEENDGDWRRCLACSRNTEFNNQSPVSLQPFSILLQFFRRLSDEEPPGRRTRSSSFSRLDTMLKPVKVPRNQLGRPLTETHLRFKSCLLLQSSYIKKAES